MTITKSASICVLVGLSTLIGCGGPAPIANKHEPVADAKPEIAEAAMPGIAKTEPLVASTNKTEQDKSSPTQVQTLAPPKPQSFEAQSFEAQSPKPQSPVDEPRRNPLPQFETPPFRLLLPTEAGMLLVDLEILIDDVPLAKAFKSRIEQLLADADANEDHATSWEEFLDHLDSDTQQFGTNVAGNRGQRRGLIQLQDRNRNGNVEFDEAVNVLFRTSGFDAPFRLRGTDFYRGRKSESALFAAVDLDKSGGLSESEIDRAAESLLLRDQNTDQRIDLDEIISPVDGNDDPAWDRRRSNRHGTVATDLHGYVDWSMMTYSLDDLRRKRPFGLADNPIDKLDENDDDTISKQELKSILHCDPDVIVQARFSEKPGDPSSLSVRWARTELQTFVQNSPFTSLIAFADPQLSFSISLTDRIVQQNRIPAVAFAMLDANADGELDAAEIPDQLEQQYSLEKFDADNNGKLTLAEINQGLAGKSPIWNVQVRGRGAEFPDALFASVDADHNLTLSTREIMTAPKRLRTLADDVTELSADDLPTSFMVQIVRGDPQQRQQLFRLSPPTKRIANGQLTPPPRWAKRMDVNLDDEISELEFVGSTQQFRRLDTNDDGFIEMAETLVTESTK